MTKEFNCSDCKKDFKDANSLSMHNFAKHSKTENKSLKLNYKKIRNWGIFILIFVLIFWGLIVLMKSSIQTDDLSVTEINIGSHANIALHIHSDLKIIINGKEFIIPANIGVSPGIMRPVHTHDSTGEIHIEGPFKRDFTLGDFFQVWGETFNSECIFDKCVDKGTLVLKVNGIENNEFENYFMKDGDEILIEYKSLSE